MKHFEIPRYAALKLGKNSRRKMQEMNSQGQLGTFAMEILQRKTDAVEQCGRCRHTVTIRDTTHNPSSQELEEMPAL